MLVGDVEMHIAADPGLIEAEGPAVTWEPVISVGMAKIGEGERLASPGRPAGAADAVVDREKPPKNEESPNGPSDAKLALDANLHVPGRHLGRARVGINAGILAG